MDTDRAAKFTRELALQVNAHNVIAVVIDQGGNELLVDYMVVTPDGLHVDYNAYPTGRTRK